MLTFTRIWNDYRCPFGNYREPYPYPEKRRIQAEESFLGRHFGEVGMYLWWHRRNPWNNLTHNWLGICPVKEYGGDKSEHVKECRECVWEVPDPAKWEYVVERNDKRHWQHKKYRWLRLPYREFFNGFVQIGWRSRGSLTSSLSST